MFVSIIVAAILAALAFWVINSLVDNPKGRQILNVIVVVALVLYGLDLFGLVNIR